MPFGLIPKRTRRNLMFSLLRITVALALAFAISQIKLEYWESALYDARMRLRPSPESTHRVSIVLLNAETIEKRQGTPGLKDHALFLETLEKMGPEAIVYDLDPTEWKGSEEDLHRFLKIAERLPQLTFLTSQLEMKGEDSLRYPPPFHRLRLESGPKSSDTTNFAKDQVTRRFLIQYQDQTMAHLHLARLFRPDLDISESIRGEFNFLGTRQAYINFRPPKTIRSIPFEDLLDHQPTENLSGQIVVIGADTLLSEQDYARTPYSREAVGMTSAEVHANIIETLLRNDSPARAPAWFDWLWVALISILTVYVVFSLRPTLGLLVLGATLFSFAAINFFLFWIAGLWIDLSHPLLAVFLCYYFLIPYRLIIENRHRWEIYQKHQLLQQVEELKTNFISMMSHDLKTPIARIQGMTDMIERDPNPLATPQREALDTIRSSSDDLLNFVNSILQYGRVESQQLHLEKVSKDLNEILKSSIRQNEFLARLKKISLVTELEPLFPVPVDPELIRQVFSNLLENAVKYSPEESKILISSEEKDGFIIVQIADQGPGIPPEELPHIFMKFFRSKQAKSSPVKGSGLGLYLAQYFTELHQGTVSVESSYGQGTTFTVKLPISAQGV